MDLYHRWENQNWSTQDLDFTEDAEHWKSMTGVFEGFRTELQRSFTLFFVGEQAVTDTLSPLVHAAPDEPSRIFLSTQLVDEARHSVFFSRFFDEVIGISGGLSAALDAVRDQTVGGFRDDLRRRPRRGDRHRSLEPARLRRVGRGHHDLPPGHRGDARADRAGAICSASSARWGSFPASTRGSRRSRGTSRVT